MLTYLLFRSVRILSNPCPRIRSGPGTTFGKGRSKSRGIGVFAVNSAIERLTWNRKYRVSGAAKSSSSASWKTDDLQEFLTVRVNDQINVVAVWTKQDEGGTFSYAGQLWKFLQSHRKDMIKNECLLIGDLNSNVQWDRAGRWWNHSDNVAILEEIGMLSLYHEQEGVPYIQVQSFLCCNRMFGWNTVITCLWF